MEQPPAADMRQIIENFAADIALLERSLPAQPSPTRDARLRDFLQQTQADLENLDFGTLPDRAAKIDYLLLQGHLYGRIARLDLNEERRQEAALLLPFAPRIDSLEAAHWRRERAIPPSTIAASLNDISKQCRAIRTEIAGQPGQTKPLTALRAAEALHGMAESLKGWFGFYDGYDPLFSWWAREPYKAVETDLKEYETFLRETVAGQKSDHCDTASIVGAPVGRRFLVAELAREGIDTSPEELITIGDREYAWCEAEMRKTAHEMGCGDDWRAALEKVKERHVAPGEQAEMVRELAEEAISFVEERDLVTIPPLARECWRMGMMTPEAQKVNPFFLGGEIIQISFPTDAMSHERKQMSLRGNNRHFARATVQHELIPGHHLQLFQAARWRAYRHLFTTPFFIEGWTLHWEMLLWEQDFPRSPEDRIGMLFWKMHRCARITFSLRFHLEEMTPAECVDLLVERVGHERENAIAEVRRSCGDAYPPLYQCAYLLGGLQMHSLYRERIASGQSSRTFHDAVLLENSIPISLLRAALDESIPLEKDAPPTWRFG